MNVLGKLIAIDGVDASGKETHCGLLYDRLKAEENQVKRISFPAYQSPSSELVKMYLSGDFGENPSDVNAYAASTLFAADRFASFRTDWGKDYKNGAIIIADRYVSSNMIHQASKLAEEEKDKFLDWLDSFEYEVYELPRPDITIFLDMPPEYGAKLMAERENKFSHEAKKDIHERNFEYLTKSYNNACMIADKYGWTHISCVQDGKIRTIEDINDEIYNNVKSIL